MTNHANAAALPIGSNASECAIEAEIRTKGLNAPRVTPDQINAVIVGETYHVFPGSTLTICALTLRNGFIVTGESAAASPENFDEAIGRRISRDNARNKIWALEGYLLRAKLATGAPSLDALRGAVARGWCADANRHKVMDTDLADAIVSEVARLGL